LPAAFNAPLKQAVDRQASLTAACWIAIDERLKQQGSCEGAAGIPIQFFVEVAAILQIKMWEENGLLGRLPVGLPSSDDAAAALLRRAATAPQDFAAPDGLQLSPQILIAWLVHFAWSAPNFFQADFVLDEVDDDSLVEAIAQLLWRHRDDRVER
jgi:hypothetical protein